jgi:U2-associated protein SR140
MAFKFSLGAAKAGKPPLNLKAKEDEEAKEREEKAALEKVMADFEEEHSGNKSILGESERDHGDEEDVFVPTGNKRHFTGRQRSMKSGPGTLEPEALDGFPRPGAPGRLAPQAQSRFGGGVPTRPSGFEGPKRTENVYTTLVAKASNLPPASRTAVRRLPVPQSHKSREDTSTRSRSKGPTICDHEDRVRQGGDCERLGRSHDEAE